ncbi:hypothetical protein TNCV_3567281 [Trichonephila clavipes]|nr:hypothetical protein TNCV_3567281 [Trichonephila clavipes]
MVQDINRVVLKVYSLRSNESQYSRNNGLGESREVRGKMTGLKEDQGERHTSIASKRGPLIRSSPSSGAESNRRVKKSRKETLCYKRSLNSGSGGPERKRGRRILHQGDKRKIISSNNSLPHSRKKSPERGNSDARYQQVQFEAKKK